jgi:hypothetical protein
MPLHADPTRHLLSSFRHQWSAQNQPVSEPVTFAAEAAASRQALAAEAEDPQHRRIEITAAEALVSASLLKEFAARLRQGAADGSLAPDSADLATLAADIAERHLQASGLAD